MLDALHAADGSANRDQWYLDNWGAVCAEIGASQQLTPGVASHLLLIGIALRDRLPKIAALFTDGLIGYRLVATIVHRTGLIKDPAALRAVDAALALLVQQWGAMSLDKTDQAIDALIAEHDPYALRRTQTKARGRSVDVFLDDATGLATLWAVLFATDAEAFDQRLDALGSTVCDNDPRTQRSTPLRRHRRHRTWPGPPGLPLRPRRVPRGHQPAPARSSSTSSPTPTPSPHPPAAAPTSPMVVAPQPNRPPPKTRRDPGRRRGEDRGRARQRCRFRRR